MIVLLSVFTVIVVVHGYNYTLEEINSWKIPENILTDFPSYHCGHTYENAPVWYAPLGAWDIRSVVEQGPEQVDLYKKYVIKLLQTSSIVAGNASQGMVVIANMDGFDVRQSTHAGTLLLHIWGTREWAKFIKFYSIHHAIMINSNFLFQRIFDVTGPLLGSFQNLIESYGTNPNTWKPRLLKLIPADQLPDALGGTVKVKECTRVVSIASLLSTLNPMPY